MFESAQTPSTPESVSGANGDAPDGGSDSAVVVEVNAFDGKPLEFIYRGQNFQVRSIVEWWRESGGWWNRIGNGRLKNEMTPLGDFIFDDGEKTVWRVEAAPEGALVIFEIELDEVIGKWQIRPITRSV